MCNNVIKPLDQTKHLHRKRNSLSCYKFLCGCGRKSCECREEEKRIEGMGGMMCKMFESKLKVEDEMFGSRLIQRSTCPSAE